MYSQPQNPPIGDPRRNGIIAIYEAEEFASCLSTKERENKFCLINGNHDPPFHGTTMCVYLGDQCGSDLRDFYREKEQASASDGW